jgi:hypothetical protein
MNESNFIEFASYYMNPETGSVDLGEEWFLDFISREPDGKGNILAWEEWGGDSLVKVIYDEQKKRWVEA